MNTIRVACCQFQAVEGDSTSNVRRMAEFAEEAAGLGARIVLYPELIVTGYIEPARIAKLAEPISGPSVQFLAQTAERLGVSLAFGFAERREDSSSSNSLVFLGSNGEVAGVYRKVHLWDTEKKWARPGESSTVLWMEGARTGGWICYDTRFPELARSLALEGMELALVATAWLGPGEEWELALRARALDNSIFVAGADIVAPSIGCHGRSLIVDPHGNVIARARPGSECLIIADLEASVMEKQRARVPLLRDRRPDSCRAASS